jgi:Transposase DDE domain
MLEEPTQQIASLDQDWATVQQLLPAQWQDMARQLGAFKRGRVIPDADVLLRVMLIHLTDGCALRKTAAKAHLGGLVSISDVAVFKRLRNCADWFEWMCQQLRAAWLPQPLQPQLDSCWSPYRIRMLDGSVISEPGPTGSKWRLHYSIDFPSLRADEVIVSTSQDGETLKRFTFQRGQIALADRGFANPPGVAHVYHSGAHVVVRMNLVTLPLYRADGQRLDVLDCVQTLQPGQCGAWDVWVKDTAARTDGDKDKSGDGPGPRRIAGRLCAVRKSDASADKARARANRESQRSGCKVQPQTLLAANYVLLFTTLDKTFAVQQVLELYRARWQIELVFKRLKSLAGLGHLKKHDPRSARAWLQGKLLGALLVEALLSRTEHFSPWGPAKPQPVALALSVA